ncbi:MAG: ABC transporter ATP-binding protein [Bacteroidota bacterium]
MSTHTIEQISEQLKEQLSEFPQKGAKAIVSFSRDFGITPEFKQRAILLKLDYMDAENEDEQAQSIQEMHQLVDLIVEDYRNHFTEDMKARKKAQADAYAEKVEANTPKRDVVFMCHHLGKTYSSRRGGEAFSLKLVSLEVRLGEILGVVGENGNGKTTLLRCIAGELQHTSGEMDYPLLLKDTNEYLDWKVIKPHIAYIPQDLPKWYGSLEDNLAYEAAVHGIRGAANRDAVNYIVHRLGLSQHLDRKWKELSGGFKLRFALARALVWQPKLLIIDEPLANLDINTQLIVLNDLRSMASSLTEPLGIVITSQHLVEIENISDQLLFLRKGEVVYYGPKQQLGMDRQHNTFEFATDLPLHLLEEQLGGLQYVELSHNGQVYVMTAPMNVTIASVVSYLSEKGIQVSYMRDISQSTKKLFL